MNFQYIACSVQSPLYVKFSILDHYYYYHCRFNIIFLAYNEYFTKNSRLQSSCASSTVEKDLPFQEPSVACPSLSRRPVKSCLATRFRGPTRNDFELPEN